MGCEVWHEQGHTIGKQRPDAQHVFQRPAEPVQCNGTLSVRILGLENNNVEITTIIPGSCCNRRLLVRFCQMVIRGLASLIIDSACLMPFADHCCI